MSAFECPKPRVLSRVTGTIIGSVYLWVAGKSLRIKDLHSSHPLQHRTIKTLGLDGQERSFPVHLPAPARGD